MENRAETAILIPAGAGGWEELLQPGGRSSLESSLPAYVRERRWFGGKARRITAVRIRDSLPVRHDERVTYVTLLQVEYSEGGTERYALPLAFAQGEQAHRIAGDAPHAVVAHVRDQDGKVDGVLYDAVVDHQFCAALLDMIAANRELDSSQGRLRASRTEAFARWAPGAAGSDYASLDARVVRAEQSNTSVIFGQQLIMKLFRRLEAGINPDLEIGRFLTEASRFAHIPPVAGAIEYLPKSGEAMSVAILQGFVANQGDAWQYTLDALSDYLRRAQSHSEGAQRASELAAEEVSVSTDGLLDLAEQPLSQLGQELSGGYVNSARLLGRRTAELHLALAGSADDPDFAPEPFTEAYRQALYQSATGSAERNFQLLRATFPELPPDLQADARRVLQLESKVMESYRAILDRQPSAMRIRCHGDYHLGQVLYTGQDFYIIDFEGEPARPLRERRVKSSALQDVAGMLRSFHYASHSPLHPERTRDEQFGDTVREEEARRAWHRWVTAAFMQGYIQAAGAAPFMPETREELRLLLDFYQLDKAIYELGYELNNRPSWVGIPCQGILQLLVTGEQ